MLIAVCNSSCITLTFIQSEVIVSYLFVTFGCKILLVRRVFLMERWLCQFWAWAHVDWIWTVSSQESWCVSVPSSPKYFVIIQIIWFITLSVMIHFIITVDSREMIVLPFGFLVGSWPALLDLCKRVGIQWISARGLWMRVSSMRVRPFQQIGAGHWCWGGEGFVLTRTFQSI